jgi:hypothetical protein
MNNMNMTIEERETQLAELEEDLVRKRAQEKLLMDRIEFLKKRRDDGGTADDTRRKEDFSQI